MGDPSYRTRAWENRYEGSPGELNRLVDELIRDSGRPMPYTGPEYGGVEAEALLLLRDPGPKTQLDNAGSGFLSIENDDPSAARLNGILASVGLPPSRLVSWNVYPWYINRAPSASEQRAGVAPLERIVEALPKLRAIVLMGATAQKAWTQYVLPSSPTMTRLEVFESLLCSGRGITDGGKHSAAVGESKVCDAYRRLAAFLD